MIIMIKQKFAITLKRWPVFCNCKQYFQENIQKLRDRLHVIVLSKSTVQPGHVDDRPSSDPGHTTCPLGKPPSHTVASSWMQVQDVH